MELLKNKKKSVVIGMIHLAPLDGCEGHPGFEVVKLKMIRDLEVLLAGKVDAIIIENNYDLPHYEKALKSTVPQFEELSKELRKRTDLPLGISLLWNDFENALDIAKKHNFQFIRVPVFVDRVKTSYGIFEPKAKECIDYREKIGAEHIGLMADIQVKHAEHLIERSIAEAAKEAVEKGADALIVTGKWTGDPPTKKDVEDVQTISGDVPVVLGSGVTAENINNYDVHGVIVGSYFKGDERKFEHEQNLYPWEVAYDIERVKKLTQAV
ncbi:photosystem I assembly BtpA [Candidatus Falkowbacteria bacterium CG10_big_fil_rev_8_21_14_0_10_39_11]|uniref:Photosystem I assembly BtpA n=1 Tax=Candidatus Falkowbacteria bacterium CG10_big_fil_rev_8_21_14_0_10_39_11 TaxID=1974565 RepID=A0A2H0V5F2_9BACT|nr:MAG: photosystem I assembly BtpA [Candidatus Falkowbacteria bacterium CG10_big_fil_rev_8_21_14_0_10_39_11]